MVDAVDRTVGTAIGDQRADCRVCPLSVAEIHYVYRQRQGFHQDQVWHHEPIEYDDIRSPNAIVLGSDSRSSRMFMFPTSKRGFECMSINVSSFGEERSGQS